MMHSNPVQRQSPKNRKDGIVTAKENGRFVVENAAALAGKTAAEIDLKEGVVRKTWKLMGFARSRTYELGDHVAVQIEEKRTILEGYDITSFGVYLTGRGRKIRIASTGDLNEAHLIQSQITEFLKESAVKCPAVNTTVSGA